MERAVKAAGDMVDPVTRGARAGNRSGERAVASTVIRRRLVASANLAIPPQVRQTPRAYTSYSKSGVIHAGPGVRAEAHEFAFCGGFLWLCGGKSL